MDTFLEAYNLLRLNQKELENLNRPITINEIEVVVKKLPTYRSPGPDAITAYRFYKQSIGNITLSDERLNAFSLILEMRQG